MPQFNPIQLLQALLMIQSLLLAAFLWRRLWPLAAFLALLGLHMGWNLALTHGLHGIPDARAAFAFAYGPLILAFVRQLAWTSHPRLSAWHALPSLLAPALLFVWPFALRSLWTAVAISIASYLWASFRELARFHRTLRATHSAFELQSLQWLRESLWGLVVLAAIDTLRMALRPALPALDPWLGAATFAGALGFVYFLVWRGLQQPQLFAGLAPADVAVVAEPSLRAPLNELELLASQLQQHLDETQPQLDSELSVQKLADRLGWPAKQVSAVINQHYGRNFNDVINAARVASACALLSDPARQGDKLLAIQLDAGFGSKTVFNAAFKRETGLTPSAWRATHGSKPER
jgi:AraC-like DNA-binding protein